MTDLIIALLTISLFAVGVEFFHLCSRLMVQKK